MKIKLLIATGDSDYTEHLSRVLIENFADTFEVNVCSSIDRLRDLLAVDKFDAALLEPFFTSAVDLGPVRLPLVLADDVSTAGESENNLRKIRKYQRVSSLAGSILEYYAEVSLGMGGFSASRGKITAVWSPAGGSGKTTVALLYSASRSSEGKQALYLNLEDFSSVSAFFPENGKSISKAFEKMESNLLLFLQGIRQQDGASGLMYFCSPENYDDINILKTKDLETLLNACAEGIDELVVDLPASCGERVQTVFAAADTVFIVSDPSVISQAKLKQFTDQHTVFSEVKGKAVFIGNKGVKTGSADFTKEIQLPFVNSADPVFVFRTLSGANIPW